MKAGETTLALTATLREKKPRKADPLPEHLREAHKTVVDEWSKRQPEIAPALAWKAIRPLLDNGDGDWSLSGQINVLKAMATALDWNVGRKYLPAWFVKEFREWEQRTAECDPFAYDDAYVKYRQRFGLR